MNQLLLSVVCISWLITLTESIDINIGGIFKVNSIGETAFSLAILKYNQRPNRKFRLTSTLAMLKEFESNIIMRKICQQTSENDVVAIFGGNFSFVIQEINDVSKIIRIPFFTTDLDLFQGEEINKTAGELSYLVHMHPPIVDALVDYLLKFEWFTFSYICNSGQGLYRLQNIVRKIHLKKDYVELNIDVRYISDPRLATKDLRNLDSYLNSQDDKRILIDIDSAKNLEIVLHRIVLMGMNRPEYYYIIISTCIDEINLEEFQYSGVKILGFKVLTENNNNFRNFKSNWDEWIIQSRYLNDGDNIYEAALMMDAINTFTAAVEKILENSITQKALLSYIENKQNVDCYMVRSPDQRKMIGYQNQQYTTKNSRLGELILNTVLQQRFENGLTGPIEFTADGIRKNFTVQILIIEVEKGPIGIGNWSTKNRLKISNVHQKNDAFDFHRNKTIRVVTILSRPFMKWKKKSDKQYKGNDRFEGFCADLLNYTATMLNFKYEIHLVHDNNYGAQIGVYPNGTEIWNGMIGELLNGTADMIVAPLTISLARAKVVHFSEPFLTFGLSVMIKKPGKKKAGIFSFLRPLSNEVWGCYLAACLVVSGGLYVIARMSPYEWNITEPYHTHQKIRRDFTFFNSLWFSIAAFVQQGVDVAPKSPGARILSSVWWFFTLIMIAYYTANLAAFLTISLMITPINDWPDLAKPTIGIEYGTLNSGSTKNFFMTTTIQPYKTMGLYIKNNPKVCVNSIDEGVARVRKSKGNYAFLLESRMNEFFNNRLPCDTMMVGTPYGDQGYGIAMPINYKNKEAMNDVILTLREKQELAKLYKKWWIDKGECTDEESKSNSAALLLINVAGVFYILAGGLVFAMMTSMVEFYCDSRRMKKEQRVKENVWFSTSVNYGVGPYPMIFSDPKKPLRLAEQFPISAQDI